MIRFNKSSKVTLAIIVFIAGCTAFFVSSLNDSELPLSNSEQENNAVPETFNADQGGEHEILLAILTELTQLKSEVTELKQSMAGNAPDSNLGGISTEQDEWWAQQKTYSGAIDTSVVGYLPPPSPRKKDYENEEEYQQAIRDLQAKLDEQALKGPDPLVEQQRAERMEQVRRTVEEDLGHPL